MPASYAHFCFGREVLPRLTARQQEIISHHRNLYDLGLHGPDLFFFYHAVKGNPVSRMGFRMHEQSGREVFRRFAVLLDKNPSDEARAYLWGFLCHFALDSSCHLFIDQMAALGVGHSLLEAELDRSFLQDDGFDAFRHDVTLHIHPSPEAGRIVAQFFPNISAAVAQQAMKDMKAYTHLLVPGNDVKYHLLQAVFSAMGKADTYGAMMPAPLPNPACTRMVARARELYREAIPLAVTLIDRFPDLTHPQYRLDFGGKPVGETEDA